jgi:hypothetical protein
MRTKRAAKVLLFLQVLAPAVAPASARAGEEPAPERPGTAAPRSPAPEHGLELRPYAGWALAQHSLTGAFGGADVTYRLGPHWAVGVDGALYAEASPGPAPSYPLSEIAWSADLDVEYLPWAPRPEARVLEGYVMLPAPGLVASRPVAVVDPANRHFDDSYFVQFSGGIGARMYLGASVALTLELRDMVYFDKRENPLIAAGPTTLPLLDPSNPKNQETWYARTPMLTNCVELRLGVSFFLGG